MKARIKATGEVWPFSQIDEITFKSAMNGHLYCAEELEFLEPSVFSPDYWTRLEHTYAGMAMQGILANSESELDYKGDETLPQALAGCAVKVAHALVEKLKESK